MNKLYTPSRHHPCRRVGRLLLFHCSQHESGTEAIRPIIPPRNPSWIRKILRLRLRWNAHQRIRYVCKILNLGVAYNLEHENLKKLSSISNVFLSRKKNQWECQKNNGNLKINLEKVNLKKVVGNLI